MRKKNNNILLALTGIVLVICAMMPTIAAGIGDYFVDDTISYQEMKTVQLFREINDTEKLYLLKTGSAVEISEERCNYHKENMDETVESLLSPYLDSGLLKGQINEFSMESESLRYYSTTDANLSVTIWRVQMELWDDLGQSILLYFDDQDGKILAISYECLEKVYDTYEVKKKGTLFPALYLSFIDWSGAEYENGLDEEPTYSKNVQSRTYRIGDKIYGEIGIRFTISEYGFRIYLEDSAEKNAMQQ